MFRKPRPLGMPADRPFSLKASAKNPLFLVSRSGLNLDDFGVDHLNYGDFGDISVYGFNREEMEELLNRSKLVMSERYGTKTAHVEWVFLDKKPVFSSGIMPADKDQAFLEYPFKVDKFNGHSREMFGYLVSRMLGPIVKRKIILEVPHGHYHEYNDRGAFQVYIWSSSHPDAMRNRNTPWQIWGYDVGCEENAFSPIVNGEMGVFIKDGNYTVAELRENALYVHHDLVHYSEDSAFRLMRDLLNIVGDKLSNPAVFKQELENVREEYREKQRNIFSELILKSIPQRSQRNKLEIKSAKEKAARLRTEYLEAERKVFGLEKSLVDPNKVADQFKKEFAKLQSGTIEMVDGVEVVFNYDGSFIQVLTKEIRVENPHTQKIHSLGRFKINLYLEAESNANIRILRRDGEVDEDDQDEDDDNVMIHPHVDEDGYPCLGNLSEVLPGYIAHYEVEAAVSLAIAFLQTVNLTDAYQTDLSVYPVVEDEQTEGED